MQKGQEICCVKETVGSGSVCVLVVGGWGFGLEGVGVASTMTAIVYQSPSSINQDDPGLIGLLVKLVSRPPVPPLA